MLLPFRSLDGARREVEVSVTKNPLCPDHGMGVDGRCPRCLAHIEHTAKWSQMRSGVGVDGSVVLVLIETIRQLQAECAVRAGG